MASTVAWGVAAGKQPRLQRGGRFQPHASLQTPWIAIDSACAADFKPGDSVKTLRGSMSGRIVRVLSDGRVVWRADSGTELTTLPESLIRKEKM